MNKNKIKDIFNKAIDDNGNWKIGIKSDEVLFLKNYIQKLEQQNEDLKCCGNCRWYYPCTFDSDNCSKHDCSTEGNNLCDSWRKE